MLGILSKATICLGISCLLTLVTNQVAFTQVRRYPSVEEALNAIQNEWMPKMPERLQEIAIYQDQRSEQDIQNLQAFREAWATISPVTASFLGEWNGSLVNQELFVAVYPSNNFNGRVCIIQYEAVTNTYRLGVGTIQPNPPRLNVTGGNDFVVSLYQLDTEYRDHMVQVSIDPENDITVVGNHVAFPHALREPTSFMLTDFQAQQFESANCTTGLPEIRNTPWVNTALDNEETIDGVTFRFRGADVDPNSIRRSVIVYWVIENLSNQPFIFRRRDVEIVTRDGEPITCPNELPEGFPDAYGEPGCTSVSLDEGYTTSVIEPNLSMTGRVQIFLPASEIEGLELSLPEAFPGSRQFRVPIEFSPLVNE